MTVVQTAAQATIAAALRRGEARLAPWQFSGLSWAAGLDAALLHVEPTVVAVFGVRLAMGGGIKARLEKWAGRSRILVGLRREISAGALYAVLRRTRPSGCYAAFADGDRRRSYAR